MKKYGFLLLLLTFVLFFSVRIAAADTVVVRYDLPNGETITISPTDDIFYLPSSAGVPSISLNGEVLAVTSFQESEDARGLKCYTVTLPVNGKEKEYTFYHGKDIPTVFITTEKGISYIDASKDNRDKNAKIMMLDADGAVIYNDTEAETKSEIKGRGNATFTYYKKPYQIKLSKKAEVFGMDEAKTWILLANYTDQSALHNALAFALANDIGIPYAIDYRFVNLYIDGAYRGLYMITEKVQVGENRIDIVDLEKENEDANDGKAGDEFAIAQQTRGELIENTILSYYTYAVDMQSPADITGGYIVELDNNRGLGEPCHFVTENGNVYTVKAPEYASKEEMEYIAGLFADLEEAIFSRDGYNRKGIHYSEYIDMESFAGIYTLQELLKNWDAYLSSMFFFKDADVNGTHAKIYMGPLWDMDNTLGNINFNYEFGEDIDYLWAQNGVFQDVKRDFAKKLMQHSDFRQTVADIYDQAYLLIQDYLTEGSWFDQSVAQILPSVMMDRTRWKLYDANSWLLNAAGRKSNVKFVHFTEYGSIRDESKHTALGFLRYYLTERMDALVTLIGNGEIPQKTETARTEPSPTEIITLQTETNDSSATNPTEDSSSQATATEENPINITILVIITIGIFVGIGVILLVIKKKKS